MKGLLLKDFYMILKYGRSFIFIMVLFLVLSCFGNDNIFFAIYPTLVAGMIPVTLISYDEREKWNIYAETLPYTRVQIVSSKYLIGLLFEFAIFVLSALAQAYRMISVGDFTIGYYLPFILSTLVAGLIAPSLMLPVIFRFGAEKGRIAYYVIIGALCAGGTMIAGTGVASFTEKIDSNIIMLCITVAAVVMYMCSWGLSVRFYKKHQF